MSACGVIAVCKRNDYQLIWSHKKSVEIIYVLLSRALRKDSRHPLFLARQVQETTTPNNYRPSPPLFPNHYNQLFEFTTFG